MDTQQLILFDLIKAAIENGNVNKEAFLLTDWEALYQETLAHSITPFIFPPVDKLHKEGVVPDTFYEKVQHQALITGLRLEQMQYNFSGVLKSFNEAGIPVLLVKGVVLRSIYPYPQLRTMGDADILVHKEHLEKSAEILAKHDYICDNDESPIHLNFYHPQKLSIEVHWALTQELYIKSTKYLEDNIWAKTIPTAVCGVPSLTLKQEDHLLYLLLHMAGHFVASGFGLRQIIDVALFLRSIYETADWDYLNKIIKICSMERFSKAIFYISHKYFSIELPEGFSNFTDEEKQYSENLLEDAFISGNFGHRTKNTVMKSGLVWDENKVKYGNQFICYVNQFFPGIKRISAKYKILNKYPVLLPFVWIYRVLEYSHKGMTVRDIIIQPELYKKRGQLIEWLNIN